MYPVVTSGDGGQVGLGACPTSTLKFTRESEAVSLCAICGIDDQLQVPRDLIATVTRSGSVVVYCVDLLKVTERAPASPDDPYTRVCARAELLVAVRRSGKVEVLRIAPPAVEEEVTVEASVGKSCLGDLRIWDV